MASTHPHYTQSRTSLGVAIILLTLLTSQVTALGFTTANTRKLSGTNGQGHAQVTSFCRVYSTSLTCLSCIRDYYLSNNVCVPVAQASRIEGCNVYRTITTCAECDNGRFLSVNNTSCQLATGNLNCLRYINNTACASCPQGFALNAVTLTCSAIPNCAQSNGTTCTACVAGFYLNVAGACAQLSNGTTIANCSAYLANGSCGRCGQGFIAGLNGTSCISGAIIDNQIDPFCVDQRLQDGTVCSLCRQGYTLRSGRCELVLNSESCLVFDPDTTNNCLICMSGYSMLSLTGGCSLNALTNPGIVDPVGSAAIFNFANVALLVVLGTHFA